MRADLILGMVALSTSIAQAQPGPPPPPPSPHYAPPPSYVPPAGRSGFFIGISVGGGQMIATDCSGCDSLAGLAFDFSIGSMISPSVGIMYDAFAVLRPEDGSVLTNATNTVAAQIWLTPKFWLKGGVGFSQIRITTELGESAADYGFGATAGAGFEIVSSPRFAIDIAGRVSHGTFDGGGVSNAAAVVGFHWY